METIISMQLTRLNITECISINDHRRVDQGLIPICSIRELAFMLEFRWPYKYNSSYIKDRLYRANLKGIGKMPPDLINDIISLLEVSRDDLVHYPSSNKKGTPNDPT